MLTLRPFLYLALMCVVLFSGGPASAATVSWTAQGLLPGYPIDPIGLIAPNDPVRMSFLMDSDAQPSDVTPDGAFYTPLTFSGLIGPYAFDASNSRGLLWVVNVQEFYFLIVPNAGMPRPDLEILQIAFGFQTLFAMVNPAVPLQIPTGSNDVFDMDARTAQGIGTFPMTDRQFQVEPRVQPVPIPALAPLSLAALLALVGASRSQPVV